MNRLCKLNFKGLETIQTRFISVSSSTGNQKQKAVACRSELKNMNRVVVKLGSAVITRQDECGIALGRLASIVEQISELQNSGKQMLMVTSGAVAFGKQKLNQSILMSKSVREAVGDQTKSTKAIDPRACAASGQCGLMSLYSAMFSQYGIHTAQVLVNKADFYNEYTRRNLKSTLKELLNLNIVPILNTNDAIAPQPEKNIDIQGVISIKDNDSLAARLAVLIEADFLLIMSDVNGLYSSPPGTPNSHLLNTFNPNLNNKITYGAISNVGTGGMQSKIEAATWALKNDCSVVICNGELKQGIIDTIDGKKVGTFFTNDTNTEDVTKTTEEIAIKAREAGRKLQQLTSDERSDIIRDFAGSLTANLSKILSANELDIKLAKENNLSAPLLNRLALTETKINSLIDGMNQIADNSNILGKVVKCTKLTDDLLLQQLTVPLGVLMVIFESRPDSLPQICALSISSGNALLLKGGSEAANTNKILHRLVQNSLEKYVPKESIVLLNSREEISDLLELDSQYIDLIIPRGSNSLVKSIQNKSKSIPVLGHAEGICHVYIDKEADPDMAIKLVKDSKCDYPSACNALETLLIHKSLVNTELFNSLIEMLRNENVKINSGPSFHKTIKFAPSLADNLKHEYSDLELTIELVDDVQAAIKHINKYGSSHTESIITSNKETASKFLKNIDSACVFHNTSTRMADGYRFGLGAEVGVSTGRIHARGPVGVDGLLTTKWILSGKGETAAEFSNGIKQFTHENIVPQSLTQQKSNEVISNIKIALS